MKCHNFASLKKTVYKLENIRQPIITVVTDYTGLMQKEYAIVIIIVIATVITPASDAFTLSLVVLPVWILHEISIMIVNKTYYSMKENR